MRNERGRIKSGFANESIWKSLHELSRFAGRWSLAFVFLLIGISGSGCASIVKSKGRQIAFESDPPGATVRMKGAVVGKTPCIAAVKGAPIVMFELEGYHADPTSLTGKYKVEPWIFGNLLFGFGAPVGIIVDSLNGRMTRLESPFHVTFLKNGASAFTYSNNPLLSPQVPTLAEAPTLKPVVANGVADRLKALKELKDQGVLSDSEYEAKKAELIKEL